jgi:hypothetical protein
MPQPCPVHAYGAGLGLPEEMESEREGQSPGVYTPGYPPLADRRSAAFLSA